MRLIRVTDRDRGAGRIVAVIACASLLVGGITATEADATAGARPNAVAPSARAGKLAFRAVKTVSHTLRGNFNGNGPAAEGFSSTAIGDITGDVSPEIVMATVDGFVIALRSTNFTELWRRDFGPTAIQASPAIRQVRGSAAPDVVVATMDGRISVLDGPTGKSVLSVREGPSLFCPPGPDCRPHGFFGTPAVADIDGDGRPDIVASSYDHNIYAWTALGRPIFRQFVGDTVWSSPVVGDVDGDRRPEVVVGSDSAAYGGGLVWVFSRGSGRWVTYPGYPRFIPGQTVWSTPALKDVNGDHFVDIVVGTGNNFPRTSTTQRVYAFTAVTHRDLPGWPVATTGQVSTGPAVADVNGNGTMEVAFASEGARVYLRGRTGSGGWTKCASVNSACSGTGGAHGGVTIADLDRDGLQEVVAAVDQDLIAFDGVTGAVKARIRFSNGHTVPPSGSPTIASIGGKTMIAVQAVALAGAGPPRAGDSARLFLFTTDQALGRADWPTFKRTATRSG